mgnify:CR=1 FL=1
MSAFAAPLTDVATVIVTVSVCSFFCPSFALFFQQCHLIAHSSGGGTCVSVSPIAPFNCSLEMEVICCSAVCGQFRENSTGQYCPGLFQMLVFVFRLKSVHSYSSSSSFSCSSSCSSTLAAGHCPLGTTAAAAAAQQSFVAVTLSTFLCPLLRIWFVPSRALAHFCLPAAASFPLFPFFSRTDKCGHCLLLVAACGGSGGTCSSSLWQK